MSQSLVKNLVHLVYSTKHRLPLIPQAHQAALFSYQAGIFQHLNSPAIIIGGVEDHVHALFSLSKNYALKKIVEEVKKGSSMSGMFGIERRWRRSVLATPSRRMGRERSAHGRA